MRAISRSIQVSSIVVEMDLFICPTPKLLKLSPSPTVLLCFIPGIYAPDQELARGGRRRAPLAAAQVCLHFAPCTRRQMV